MQRFHKPLLAANTCGGRMHLRRGTRLGEGTARDGRGGVHDHHHRHGEACHWRRGCAWVLPHGRPAAEPVPPPASTADRHSTVKHVRAADAPPNILPRGPKYAVRSSPSSDLQEVDPSAPPSAPGAQCACLSLTLPPLSLPSAMPSACSHSRPPPLRSAMARAMRRGLLSSLPFS